MDPAVVLPETQPKLTGLWPREFVEPTRPWGPGVDCGATWRLDIHIRVYGDVSGLFRHAARSGTGSNRPHREDTAIDLGLSRATGNPSVTRRVIWVGDVLRRCRRGRMGEHDGCACALDLSGQSSVDAIAMSPARRDREGSDLGVEVGIRGVTPD